jgi:hypothetical protein
VTTRRLWSLRTLALVCLVVGAVWLIAGLIAQALFGVDIIDIPP